MLENQRAQLAGGLAQAKTHLVKTNPCPVQPSTRVVYTQEDLSMKAGPPLAQISVPFAANTLDTLGTLATPGGVERSLRRVREPSPQTAKLSVASRGPWYTKKGSHQREEKGKTPPGQLFLLHSTQRAGSNFLEIRHIHCFFLSSCSPLPLFPYTFTVFLTLS